jgi:hypothetical protein
MNKFLVLAGLMLAFTVNILAQSASATASASAVILTPIAISRTADLHFGTATVSAVAGTIVLTPAGARSATGGVTLYTVAPVATVASFDVTGTASTAYAITLPGSVTISNGAIQ